MARSSRNPGAASRARQALRASPARSDRLVAIEARCDAHTVRRARRELEATGSIPATPERASRTPPPRPPSRARDAIAAGYGTREIRAATGLSRQAIWKARRGQAPAAGPASVPRARQASKASICAICGAEFEARQGSGGTPQRYCGPECYAGARKRRQLSPSRADPGHEWPRIRELATKPPDLTGAACADGRLLPPSAWTDGSREDRTIARAICLAACPALKACREYALAITSVTGVAGGMTEQERMLTRRNRKAAAQAAQ